MLPSEPPTGRPVRLLVKVAALLEVTPIALDRGVPGELFFEKRGYPEVAQAERGARILERLSELSSALGTKLSIRDGRAHVDLEAVP